MENTPPTRKEFDRNILRMIQELRADVEILKKKNVELTKKLLNIDQTTRRIKKDSSDNSSKTKRLKESVRTMGDSVSFLTSSYSASRKKS